MVSMVEDHAAEGKEFELMATFKPEGDQWCLVKVEDMPMPGYSDNEDKGEKPKATDQNESEFVNTYNAQMGKTSSADY